MASKKNEAKIKFTAETKEMREEVKAAERAIREYNSELRLNAEQMKTSGASAEALEKRYQILQEEAAQYDKKLKALNQELEAACKTWGENSEEAERLRIKINNTGVSVEKLKQQIAGTEAELSSYRKEMEEAGREADDTRNSYERLTDRIQEQKDELSRVEDAYKDAILQFGKGSDEAKELENRIKSLSQELDENEGALDEVETAAKAAAGQMDDLTESARDAGEGFTISKGAVATFAGNALTSLVGAAKDGASAIYNLADETREYRAEMAKLSSAAKSNGYSTEFAKEKYMEMYEVLADETAANTTVSNFMAMKISQDDMNQVLRAATGIWAKYGDSIPLDGLAESINETSNAGQVTGNLADALNWAGISEDDFNSRLSLCNDTQERQRLIIDTLNSKYGALADNYKKNNKQVMDANRTAAEYNDTMAELGEEMEPVTRAIKTGLMDVVKATMEMVDADTDKAAEKIGDAFEWIAENIEEIVRVGKYGATALGTIFMINKAAEFTGTIKNMISTFGLLRTATVAQTVATEGQAVAQTGLNAAMSANPIGILIAAGTALVGVMALINEAHVREQERIEEEIEQTYGLTEAQKELIGSIEERNQSYRDSIESRADEVNGIEQEYNYCQKLVEELRGIVDENGKITEGNEDRAAVITGILSDALGMEIEITDGVIQKYNELNSTIEDVIQMKKAESVASAHEEAYTEAIQGRRDAFKELSEAQKELEEATQKTADAQQEYDEVLAEHSRLTQENLESHGALNHKLGEHQTKLNAAGDALDKAKESQNKLEEAVNTTKETLNSYNVEITNYEGLQSAIISGEADAVEEALNRLVNSFITAENGTKEALEKQVDNMRETYNNLKKEVENGTPGVTKEMVNGAYQMVLAAEKELEKFDPKGAVDKKIDEMVKNTGKKRPVVKKEWKKTALEIEDVLMSIDTKKSATKKMDEYAKGINDTERKVTGAVDRTKKGIESKLDALNTYASSTKKMDEYTKGVNDKSYKVIGAANQTMRGVNSEFNALDAYNPASAKMGEYAQGVNNTSYKPIGAASQTMRGVNSEFNSLDAYSPASKKMGEYKQGISDSESKVTGAANRITRSFKSTMGAIDLSKEGYNAIAGFANGALGYDIGAAARKIADRTIQELRKGLDEHSPSKKAYEIGTYFSMGYTNALEDSLTNVADISKEMAYASIEPISKVTRSGFKDLFDRNVGMHIPFETDVQGMLGRHVQAAVSQGEIDYEKLGDIFIRAASQIDSSIIISNREFSRMVHEVR